MWSRRLFLLNRVSGYVHRAEPAAGSVISQLFRRRLRPHLQGVEVAQARYLSSLR